MQSVNNPDACSIVAVYNTTPILEVSLGLDISQCYPTRGRIHSDNYIGNVSTTVLTMTVVAPPGPDIHRLLSTEWTRGVVMHIIFVHGDVLRSVLRDEGEVCEVDRVELIKGVLALGSISSPLFLREKRV